MKEFRIRKLIIILGLCFAVLLFFSCIARINGSLAADGSAVLDISVSLEPRMTVLIQRLAAAGGTEGGPVLDGHAISASMSNAPGIALVQLRNTASAKVEGQIIISKIDEFLSVADGNEFIHFEQKPSGGNCKININLNNGPVVLKLLSPEIVDYLNALMAPLATGEELSKTEYLELVSSVYNRAISNEIAGSKIRAFIDFPGPVNNVWGGTFNGRRAEFDISLLDLLVLETPAVYEVEWRN